MLSKSRAQSIWYFKSEIVLWDHVYSSKDYLKIILTLTKFVYCYYCKIMVSRPDIFLLKLMNVKWDCFTFIFCKYVSWQAKSCIWVFYFKKSKAVFLFYHKVWWPVSCTLWRYINILIIYYNYIKFCYNYINIWYMHKYISWYIWNFYIFERENQFITIT